MTVQLKKRRPFLAAFLSLLLMGLGQLYNGQARRAVVLIAIEIFGYLTIVAFAPAFLVPLGLLALGFLVLAYLGLKLFAIVDAFRGARRIGQLTLRRYNRWYVYVGIFLLFVAIQNISEESGEFHPPGSAYSIVSGSMAPTLQLGDFVLADRDAYLEETPVRGDVVVFTLSDGTPYNKRIVGMPNESVQILADVLYINGTPVERREIVPAVSSDTGSENQMVATFIETLPNGRSHEIWEQRVQIATTTTQVYTVPAGHYFVLGDNRDASQDSRRSLVGYVPAADLVGRVEIIYFSTNGSARWWQVWRWPGAIRIQRIGTEVD